MRSLDHGAYHRKFLRPRKEPDYFTLYINPMWMDVWHDRSEGYCRIWPYDGNIKAIRYITKYVLKGGRHDIYVPPARVAQLHQAEG